MKPLIICAAITGGGPIGTRSPFLPANPDQIVHSALAAWRSGAAVLHLHARDDDGHPRMDGTLYRDLVDNLRRAGCDAIISLSAGDNGGQASHGERLAVADIDADLVSLGTGSFNIGSRIYDNAPAYIRRMARKLSQRGMRPELEIFDSGQLANVQMLLDEGVIRAPAYLQFVFGPPGAMRADARLLDLLIQALPLGVEWAVSNQTADHGTFLELMMQAFLKGGHVRTGLEDHVNLRPGELARSNAEMVEQWVQTARIWGRPVASPTEARRLLGFGLVDGDLSDASRAIS